MMTKRAMLLGVVMAAGLAVGGQKPLRYSDALTPTNGTLVYHDGSDWVLLAAPGAARYLYIAADGALSWTAGGGGGGGGTWGSITGTLSDQIDLQAALDAKEGSVTWSAVAITGGTVTGITDLAVADGGTGASTADGARTALGLGTAAVEAATAFLKADGSVNGTGTQTFTFAPTGTTPAASTLVVNPASATGNAILLWLGVNGTDRFTVDEDGDIRYSSTIVGKNDTGAAMFNEIPSGTNPTLIPLSSDIDTGVGHAADDSVSLVAGGVEAFRATEAAGTITLNAYGNLATTGTVDGRDVAADGGKLDGIEAAADVTDTTNVAAAGAVMGSTFTQDSGFLVGTGAGTYQEETGATARTSLGLGTIATQAANSVAITGGTIDGITMLDVENDSTAPYIRLYGSSSVAGTNPVFNSYRLRGTIASPSNVQSGDDLFMLAAGGYGAGYGNGFTLEIDAAEAWDGANRGVTVDLKTNATGAVTPASRLSIDGSGDVTISGDLTVSGALGGFSGGEAAVMINASLELIPHPTVSDIELGYLDGVTSGIQAQINACLKADGSVDCTGSQAFTFPPTGTTATTSSLVVNPATATADADLIWAGVGDTAKFQVDEDGDVFAGTRIYIDSLSAYWYTSGSYSRFYTSQDNGHLWEGGTVGEHRITCGAGCAAQKSLAANLDQDDVTIKRDVDGGSSYSEAGALLLLDRDVTNVTAENGNYLVCSQDGGSTAMFVITAEGKMQNKDGTGVYTILEVDPTGYGTVAIRSKASNGVAVGTLLDVHADYTPGGSVAADKTFKIHQTYNVGASNRELFSIDGGGNMSLPVGSIYMGGTGAVTSNGAGGAMTFGPYVSASARLICYGSAHAQKGSWDLSGGRAWADAAVSDSILSGSDALPAAVTNQNGGNLVIYAGNHATGGGSEGSVLITQADGSTPIATFVEGYHAHNQATVYTPSADQARANDSTITVANTIARVAGDGGAAVLDVDPAIEDGAADGQVVIIQGTSDSNTVQIADACNTALAGGAAVTLGQGDTLQLIWDAGDSVWYEVSRSNN